MHDEKVSAALLLVLVDLIMGVLAAFKIGNFRLSYLVDFLRNDILFKLLPYYVIYAGGVVAGHEKIIIPWIDLGDVAGAIYVGMMAAWAASIANSVLELKKSPSAKQGVELALAGNENEAPPKA